MENRYQVIGESGRNRIMKISIVLYLSNPVEDKILYQNLIQNGIRVCKIGDISRLHTILESQSFDGILVNSNFLALHELSSARHLWDARSPHTILVWTKTENGSISTETHAISPEISGICRSSDYYEKIECINGILSEIKLTNPVYQSSYKKNSITTHDKPAVHISEELHLHKKIRLILEYLINSGETGINCSSIIEKIWGKTEKNRTKDVQIYISKLRGILSRTNNNHCQISYHNKRYYLLNTESQKYR